VMIGIHNALLNSSLGSATQNIVERFPNLLLTRMSTYLRFTLLPQGTLRLLQWSQVPLTLEEWNARVTAQNERFRKSELLPGVHKLLRNLSRRTTPPVHMALASSASKPLFNMKASHLPSITNTFPESCQVFGNDVEMAGKPKKPAPDIFLLALERANAALVREGAEDIIRPEECLVFEDSIAGVEAARRAEMRVVWVPHPGLLEVCQGWMDEVLQGATEKEGEEVGPIVPKNGPGVLVAQERMGSVWSSDDGWAECITSLEHFPYEHYGFEIST
jgi:pseudouridine 5'-phosphatase